MTEIADLFAVSETNIGAPPLGAPERHDRDDVNEISRELMGKIRRQWEGLDTAGNTLVWKDVVAPFTVTFVDADTLLITGVDATGMFVANRKVKVTHAAGNPIYAFVTSSSFGGGNTTVNLEDFDDAAPDDAVRADANNILMFNGFGGTVEHGIDRGAFSGAVGAFEIPTALTGAAINTAIVNAVANDRIVLLRATTYTIKTPVVVLTGTRMWGLGQTHTTLIADDDLNDDVIKVDAAATGFEIRGFTIIGNQANQTEGNAIRFQEGASRGTVEDIRIALVYRHGIAFLGAVAAVQSIHLRNLEIFITGGDCIHVVEPSSGIVRCHISDVDLGQPGTGGAATVTANGLYVEGALTLSGVTVAMNVAAGNTGAGIYLVDVGSGGSPAGARCTLSDFLIEGTGQDAVGLRVGGVLNPISNGMAKMTGSAARPLLVDGRGGGAENAVDNLFSNCIFDDGVRCEIAVDAPRTELRGCLIQNQSVEGLRVDAPDVLVKDCTFAGPTTPQPDGVIVRSTAVDVEIQGCTFRDQSDDGIDVQSGSDGTVITGNVFRDMLGDAIQLVAGATNVTTGNNVYHSISGLKINDGTAQYQHDNLDKTMSFASLVATMTDFGTSPVVITGMDGMEFPRVPDGTKRFLVTLVAAMDPNLGTDDLTLQLRQGTNGDITDGVVANANWSNQGRTAALQAQVATRIVTPVADQLLTASVDADGGGNSDILGHGSERNLFELELIEAETYMKIEYVDG